MQDKNDAYWKKHLSAEQYAVLRERGTEPPFSGAYVHTDTPGVYRCAGCGTELFSSQHKFDSRSGWPSFYDVAQYGAITLQQDTSHGMERTEAVCSKCGSHLGHVFDDAVDQPTGKRYCINSVALDFSEDEKNET